MRRWQRWQDQPLHRPAGCGNGRIAPTRPVIPDPVAVDQRQAAEHRYAPEAVIHEDPIKALYHQHIFAASVERGWCYIQPDLCSEGHASMFHAGRIKGVMTVTRLGQDEAFIVTQSHLRACAAQRGALLHGGAGSCIDAWLFFALHTVSPGNEVLQVRDSLDTCLSPTPGWLGCGSRHEVARAVMVGRFEQVLDGTELTPFSLVQYDLTPAIGGGIANEPRNTGVGLDSG